MPYDEIEEQVDNAPLTKEESKAQFVEMTNRLGIKHTFSFDEAWQVGLELRKKNKFREKISELEEVITQLEGSLTGDELHAYNPIKETFADGCYVREIFNPSGQLIVTKIHKKEHPFFLMKGSMSVLTENGVVRYTAPFNGITKPGTKRIIYTHTDCVFITVHATDKKTSEEVEEEVIAKNFDDSEISIANGTDSDIALLKSECSIEALADYVLSAK